MSSEQEERIQFLVRLPVSLRAELDACVRLQGVSRNQFVIGALEEKLKRMARTTPQLGRSSE